MFAKAVWLAATNILLSDRSISRLLEQLPDTAFYPKTSRNPVFLRIRANIIRIKKFRIAGEGSDIIQYIYIYYNFNWNRCWRMATKDEHTERYGWWVNELESLGLSIKTTNEFNDIEEIRDLAENLKQNFYQDHKTNNL